jgi:stage III sporulation protein AF
MGVLMEEIYTWIRSIVIYMILNTVIINLLGDSSYKKYVSIVSGMILVLLVISPLLRVMDLEVTLNHYLQLNDHVIETSDFKNSLGQMEVRQRDMILGKYHQKIENQVRDLLLEKEIRLKTFRISIDRIGKSKTFGEITGMSIMAVLQKKKDRKTARRLPIEEIEIHPIAFEKSEDKIENHVPSPLEINIKKELSNFYHLEPDHINIHIRE